MIAYALVGTQFIDVIASLLEAFMILNLRSRVSTMETSYLKSKNIVSSNTSYVLNGNDDLETVNDLQSKIEASNHNCILLGNDFLQTVNNYFTMYFLGGKRNNEQMIVSMLLNHSTNKKKMHCDKA